MQEIIVTEEELSLINSYRSGTRFIGWSILDFESQAQVDEDATGLTLYYRSKFPEALEAMIYKHDCNNGITWDTINYYLDTYCKINE